MPIVLLLAARLAIVCLLTILSVGSNTLNAGLLECPTVLPKSFSSSSASSFPFLSTKPPTFTTSSLLSFTTSIVLVLPQLRSFLGRPIPIHSWATIIFVPRPTFVWPINIVPAPPRQTISPVPILPPMLVLLLTRNRCLCSKFLLPRLEIFDGTLLLPVFPHLPTLFASTLLAMTVQSFLHLMSFLVILFAPIGSLFCLLLLSAILASREHAFLPNMKFSFPTIPPFVP